MAAAVPAAAAAAAGGGAAAGGWLPPAPPAGVGEDVDSLLRGTRAQHDPVGLSSPEEQQGPASSRGYEASSEGDDQIGLGAAAGEAGGSGAPAEASDDQIGFDEQGGMLCMSWLLCMSVLAVQHALGLLCCCPGGAHQTTRPAVTSRSDVLSCFGLQWSSGLLPPSVYGRCAAACRGWRTAGLHAGMCSGWGPHAAVQLDHAAALHTCFLFVLSNLQKL